MMSLRDLYLSNIGQTSDQSMLFEIERALGVCIYDRSGKKYVDMNSGIAVSSLGHCHPKIVEAIENQSRLYMHTMVYGEHIQAPQVRFAERLLGELSHHFTSLYFLMSGTEATELAMKIAKKHTGRFELVACRKAYHGSSQGAESLRSDEDYKAAYLPLIPGIRHINFNSLEDLDLITDKTAGVICEVVQGEAGVVLPDPDFLKALKLKCNYHGALLIFDEIQSGFGRTGHLFAFQKYNVEPDLFMIGKAMGGGMPIAGVVSSREIMRTIVRNPALGHITTFGGHPVSCAAAEASLEILLSGNIIDQVSEKASYVRSTLSGHPIIKEVRSAGLMMAVEPTRRKYLKHIVASAFEHGVLIDWFLFNNRSFRLAPPLIISMEETKEACTRLLKAFDFAQAQYT